MGLKFSTFTSIILRCIKTPFYTSNAQERKQTTLVLIGLNDTRQGGDGAGLEGDKQAFE